MRIVPSCLLVSLLAPALCGSRANKITEMNRTPFQTVMLVVLAASALKADVRLPKILGSHAVLQRDLPIHVWGWSEPGETVTAKFNGATQTGTGDRLGHWGIYLPPQRAGGPYQLTVTGKNKIELDDILIGDVWFASGQSNMEMPLNGVPGSAVVKNAAEEIRNANQPQLRLLVIPHNPSEYPQPDFAGDATWTICSPETAAKFSAVAYFFGRDIASRERVPIGTDRFDVGRHAGRVLGQHGRAFGELFSDAHFCEPGQNGGPAD